MGALPGTDVAVEPAIVGAVASADRIPTLTELTAAQLVAGLYFDTTVGSPLVIDAGALRLARAVRILRRARLHTGTDPAVDRDTPIVFATVRIATTIGSSADAQFVAPAATVTRRVRAAVCVAHTSLTACRLRRDPAVADAFRASRSGRIHAGRSSPAGASARASRASTAAP